MKLRRGEHRTLEQIRAHYEIEKDLARLLRNSQKEERYSLYNTVYDEYYRRIPNDLDLCNTCSPDEKKRLILAQLGMIARHIDKDTIFMEIGPGDHSFSCETAKLVKRVYAVDVSSFTDGPSFPENMKRVVFDGINIPLDDDSISVAYSNQVLEHLHPEDALDQLKEIYRVLSPGGIFVCITPNRLGGPSDISSYFDKVATGLHLKEYTLNELAGLLREVGFSRCIPYAGARGFYRSVPAFPLTLLETLLEYLPYSLRKRLALSLLLRSVLGVRLVGIK